MDFFRLQSYTIFFKPASVPDQRSTGLVKIRNKEGFFAIFTIFIVTFFAYC